MLLTSDLCARALIASARMFGDDPVRAFTAKRGVLRRAMAPATVGLSDALNITRTQAARVMRVNPSHLSHAERDNEQFSAARDAAVEAVVAALSRQALRDVVARRATPPRQHTIAPPARIAVEDYGPSPSRKDDADRALIEAFIARGGVSKMPPAVAEGAVVVGLKLENHPEPLVYDWGAGKPGRASAGGGQ